MGVLSGWSAIRTEPHFRGYVRLAGHPPATMSRRQNGCDKPTCSYRFADTTSGGPTAHRELGDPLNGYKTPVPNGPMGNKRPGHSFETTPLLGLLHPSF